MVSQFWARATQGVRVIRLDEDDEIADVTVVAGEEEEDDNGVNETNDEGNEEGTEDTVNEN